MTNISKDRAPAISLRIDFSPEKTRRRRRAPASKRQNLSQYISIKVDSGQTLTMGNGSGKHSIVRLCRRQGRARLDEHVAVSVNSLEITRVARKGLDLRAQTRNEVIDGPGDRHFVVSPDSPQELIAGDDFVSMDPQQAQYFEFAMR